MVQAEQASQIGTDSRTGQDNGRLRSYRTSKADGDARSANRRPDVVPLDAALLARDGIKDFSHTVADIIAHHFPDEQTRYENTYYGINQIQPVGTHRVEPVGQELLNVFYQELQHIRRQRREHAHQQAQHQYELFILDVLFAPCDEMLKHIKPFFRNLHVQSNL